MLSFYGYEVISVKFSFLLLDSTEFWLITHLKRNYLKTYIFLLPTYLMYQNLFFWYPP